MAQQAAMAQAMAATPDEIRNLAKSYKQKFVNNEKLMNYSSIR